VKLIVINKDKWLPKILYIKNQTVMIYIKQGTKEQ